MSFEEILQREAETEIDGKLAEADSRVKQMVSEAEAEAKALLAKHHHRLEAEAQAAIQQARSAAQLEVTIARTQVKGEVLDLVRQKVIAALDETAAQPNYGEILQTLAQEALEAAETAENLVVPPDDEEKLMAWAQHQGLEVKTDSSLRLGVQIECRGGKRVENTLPERLNRAWDTLATEVSKLLWK